MKSKGKSEAQTPSHQPCYQAPSSTIGGVSNSVKFIKHKSIIHVFKKVIPQLKTISKRVLHHSIYIVVVPTIGIVPAMGVDLNRFTSAYRTNPE